MTGDAVQCACGTFAIGRCTECGTPVCGTHSALRDDRRLCRRHAAEHDAEAARRQAEGAANEARAAADASRRRTREQLAAIPDPDDRFFVTYMVANGLIRVSTGRGRSAPITAPDPAERRGLFAGGAPRFFHAPDNDPGAWTWDDDAVLAWLTSNHVLRARRITVRGKKKGLLGERTYVVGRWDGWQIGSRYYEGTYRSGGSTSGIYLVANGDVVEVAAGTDKSSVWVPRTRLNASHAPGIAEGLKLPLPTG